MKRTFKLFNAIAKQQSKANGKSPPPPDSNLTVKKDAHLTKASASYDKKSKMPQSDRS